MDLQEGSKEFFVNNNENLLVDMSFSNTGGYSLMFNWLSKLPFFLFSTILILMLILIGKNIQFSHELFNYINIFNFFLF